MKLYAFVDRDGDIRETFSGNISIDYLFELQRIYQNYDGNYWLLHEIDVTIGKVVEEKLHIDGFDNSGC
jgi:hypothetical protein